MSLSLTDVRALAEGIDRLATWSRRLLPPELSISSMSALDRLLREGPLRVSELAAREAMTQPGVTILINRLADAGYAERVPDPTDRRATLVRVTEAGETVLAERRAKRAAVLRSRLTELSGTDRELLVAALPALEHLVATSGDTTNNPGK
jgi:DNA-binding MarR family transcriptional regulator